VRRVRPISHEERLSVVDHLDELRSRLIVCAVAFVVAWGLAAWQNDRVLDIMNAPLPHGIEPITLAPAEAFYTTISNSAYVALLLALPVILYQLYAFLLPAFKPAEKRIAFPMMMLIPVLFITGVLFCYFLILSPAMHFLLNFNSDQFSNQVRARDYYGFIIMLMVAMGLAFQVPVAVVVACKLRITTPAKLRRGRRYAIVTIVVLAALLPTVDPLSLILESVPMYALYELSILLAQAWGQPLGEVSDQAAPEGSG
jgi:sec-independent protein translocase protein TatC